MRKIIIIFLISVQFSSCIKQIDFITTDFEETPVVNCLFTNDTCFWLHISQTKAINDTLYNNFIENADVNIISGSNSYKLNYLDSGLYFSDFYPEIGQNYSLDISFDGYQITAENKIPTPGKIVWVDTFFSTGFSPENQNIFRKANIIIEDNPHEENFYELVIQNKSSSPDWDNENDTIYRFRVSRFAPEQVSQITNETQNSLSNSLFFKDNFQREQSNIEIPVNFYLSNGLNCTDGVCHADGDYIFILKTVSKDYYYFYKSSMMADEIFNTAGTINSLTNLSFTNKPIKIYSNMSGANGIFAGYSVDTFIVHNPGTEYVW